MRSYKPTGSVYAYAKTVARHKLGKEAERIRKYNEKVEPLTPEMEEKLSQTTYLPEEVPGELERWINALRGLLDTDELQVVELTLEGLTDREICITLYGRSKQGITVAPIWRRIRAKAETLGEPFKLGGAQTTKGGETYMVKLNKLKGLMAEHGDTQENLAIELSTLVE